VLGPRARAHRKAPTPSEALLWSKLRGKALGVRFRRQHPAGPFILDFYCAAAGLVVEVDGASHDARGDEDRMRDEALTSMGLRILRVKAWLVERDIASVLAVIRAAL
jgi:very-short-patch-repair endonuclease